MPKNNAVVKRRKSDKKSQTSLVNLNSAEKEKILNELISEAGVLKTEEDVLTKIVIPFLEKLGYNKKEMSYQEYVDAVVGTKKVKGKADIVIRINSQPVIALDGKAWGESLKEEYVLQVQSYAKLISTPPAPIAILTNGRTWEVYDIFSGGVTKEVPSKNEILLLLKKGLPKLPSAHLEEVKRIFITLTRKDELMGIFEKCNKILNSQEGMKLDTAFYEMSKIIVCKMYEERKVLEGKNYYRFMVDFLKEEAKRWNKTLVDVLNTIFNDAIKEFKKIFPDGTKIELRYDNTVEQIVGLLEPYALFGTGEDTKGAVYEIFLKETLRGPLGQYFTPREIVDFIIELVSPRIGEKILDPAAGSGGFLIRSFLTVKRAIQKNFGGEKQEEYQKELIEKFLWGVEFDPRLAMLCKLNLILHGDGYNHIYHADALLGLDEKENTILDEGSYNLVLTNPPFSLPIENPIILNRYDLSKGKPLVESDILFLERCVRLIKPGGRLAIILPEGFFNLSSYRHVQDYITDNAIIKAIISLPGGAFRPFGGSAAKTCILYLKRKKHSKEPQQPILMANTEFVGYDHRRKKYKKINRNDLERILKSVEFRKFKEMEDAPASG